LKTKTFLIVGITCIVIISLTTTSFLNFSIFSDSQKNEVTKKFQDHSDHFNHEISLLMHERISDLQILSDPTTSILGSSEFSIEEKTQYLRMFEKATKTYSSIAIYDLTGKKIIDTRNFEIGSNASKENFFISPLSGDTYYEKIPIFLESINSSVLYFSAPVYDDDVISGVVVTTFPMYKFYDIISNDSDMMGPQVEIDIISEDGIVIYSNYDRSSILSTKYSDSEIFEQLKEDGFGVFKRDNQEHLYVVSSQSGYLSYPGSNWYMQISLPTQFAYEQIQSSQNILYVALAIIFVSSVILVIYLSGKISKPILELTKATKRIQENDYSQLVYSKGPKEFKDLSNAFNSMITSIRKQRKELEELDQAKNEFTSMITHEIKNPLVPIIGYSDILLQEESLGNLTERQKNAVQIILKNSLTLEKLTSDFLDVQKLELGKMHFDKTMISSNDVLNEVFSQQKSILDKSGISFSIKQKDVRALNLDKIRIVQIFNNLINNSVSFLDKPEKTIQIGSYKKDSDMIFYVKDNGVGIPLEKQANLFQKFYQADTTHTRKHGGTGLGLSICKGIVDAHDGQIWCESQDGVGTSIFFSIPFTSPTKIIAQK
jgi:signal transduction histidine kinase